jgi:FAD/FMN-containing dehydrogenase
MRMDVGQVRAIADPFTGDIVLPGDAEYDSARVVWNGMVDRRPAVVLRPTSAADVIAAVRFAREQDLVIAVRGGGHSISGQSTCDDGAVIDLSQMRGVRVDPERRTARANGGAHLRELDNEAQAFGLVCPVGVVSHTGVGGLTLGGGMGRLQRKFGLTIDNLLSVEVATADGRLVRASEKENADLFWGLRGAGANFGIATSFEFRLHPLDPLITFGLLIHPVDRVGELASLLRETLEAGPDELWIGVNIGRAVPAEDFPPEVAGRPAAFVSAFHCGSVEQAERDLAGLRAFGPPLVDSIETRRYLEVQQQNDEALAWGHRFYMKSAFLPALTGEVVTTCADYVAQAPDGADGVISIWPCGRAIAEVAEEDTAFTGRTAAFWIAAEILWEDASLDERCREWSRAVMAEVAPFASQGRYVNDVVESGEDVARSVYGDRKYERLVALKRAWDPDNVFRLNQNVRP